MDADDRKAVLLLELLGFDPADHSITLQTWARNFIRKNYQNYYLGAPGKCCAKCGITYIDSFTMTENGNKKS